MKSIEWEIDFHDSLDVNMFIESFFHIITFLIYAFGIFYDVQYVTIPGFPRTIGGRLKFLTFWDLIIQMLYYAFCTVLDVSGFLIKCKGQSSECPIRKKLLKFRDYSFNIIVFPLGTFIFAVFWSLYAIDRELIFPKILDAIFPGWLNHIMHTIIVPTSLIEVYLIPHKLPKNSAAYKTIILFLATYLCWTYFLAFTTNVWTYPVLEVLNWWQRILFFGGSFGVFLALYTMAKIINISLWGKAVEDVKKKAN